MSVRVARALGSWGWGAGGRRGASNFRPPPPGAVDVAELLRDATTAEEEPRGTAARRQPGQCSVLLFPGQGSQVVGMGRGLLRYPRVRELYAAASRVLGYDLLELSLRGPQEALDRTARCQPAVFVASLAAVEKLQHLQPAVRRGLPRGHAVGGGGSLSAHSVSGGALGARDSAMNGNQGALPRERARRGGRHDKARTHCARCIVCSRQVLQEGKRSRGVKGRVAVSNDP